MKKLDVVWLKRDVRLHDHGPFSMVSQSSNPFIILYLYEPDQLKQHCVHGSHIHFYNEGLIELDRKLSGGGIPSIKDGDFQANSHNATDHELGAVTACYANPVDTLTSIHQKYPIGRLLAHEETGHYASYVRDRLVRRWCRENGVQCIELQQSGVTRRLKERDDFSRKLNAFLSSPQYPAVDPDRIRSRIITDRNLPGRCGILQPDQISEIPKEHQGDREDRQMGGEDPALEILDTFLCRRGKMYQKGISSPNSSWSSCSRLSPYLTWGNVSLRRVVQSTKQRQTEIKSMRASSVMVDGEWGRSLGAFLSRMHWRAHFIQKLETEPLIEKRDMHPAYQHLRRQKGDWNQSYYQAWASGLTGYPFVDACMRCLHKHGWLNFRMRAMLVSFATYNLWLDWKRIAPHLARLFLDYEPGIHYPQLQMQSGTTGINAMRVYNVTKQGQDQDPKGIFIRKYVPELRRVPDEHIHEPWKMPLQTQRRCKTRVTSKQDEAGEDFIYYPKPIVDEKESAKRAKDAVSEVRKQSETRIVAGQVFEKHGSRKGQSDFRSGRSQPASSASKKGANKVPEGQPSIRKFASSDVKMTQSQPSSVKKRRKNAMDSQPSIKFFTTSSATKQSETAGPEVQHGDEIISSCLKNVSSVSIEEDRQPKAWKCSTCTFLNIKLHAPVCEMCETQRGA